MFSLIDIATGWHDYTKGTESTQRLMDQRLSKCDTCPYKTQMNSLGQALVKAVNEQGSIYKCGLCGCPLSPLTAAPASECKDGRWYPLGDPRNITGAI